MRKIIVSCPQDLALELEKNYYEITVLQQLIDRYIDNHPEIEDIFETKIGFNLLQRLTEKQTNYETLKNILTKNVIPEYLQNHSLNWSLDFLNNEVTINILCDCEIPECPKE